MHRMRLVAGPLGEWIGPTMFLEAFDPDAMGGRGIATFTAQATKAKTWPDAVAAWAEWSTQSNVQPTRADGKPNRPLTAYTVAVEPVPA